jgi:hypothetical protein
MQETFKRKIIKVGESVGVTIPSFLLESKKVDLGKEYNITISDEVEA